MKKYKVDLKSARLAYLDLKTSGSMKGLVERAVTDKKKKKSYLAKPLSIAAACIAALFLCTYFIPPLHDFTRAALYKITNNQNTEYVKFKNTPGLFTFYNPLNSAIRTPLIENGYFEDINKSVVSSDIKFSIDRIVFGAEAVNDSDTSGSSFFLVEYTAENLGSSEKLPLDLTGFTVEDSKGNLVNSKLYSINMATGLIPDMDFNSNKFHGIIMLSCSDKNTPLPQDLVIKAYSMGPAFPNTDVSEKTGEWKIDFSWGRKVKEAVPKNINVTFKTNDAKIPYRIVSSTSTPTCTVVTIETTNDKKLKVRGPEIPELEGIAGDHLADSKGKLYVYAGLTAENDSTYKLYYQTCYFENIDSLFFEPLAVKP